ASWKLAVDSGQLVAGSCRRASLFGARRLARGAFVAALQFGLERVRRRATPENPADDHADQQHARDQDEMRRRHLAEVHRYFLSGRRRLTASISRSTLPSRLRTDHT